ncbi:D-alanyl-D-alanine carboxypeptidase family protein [Gordoniibacillus kamchatkensis]|uniref:D-alanyl-D-alanine carboxypeptidase family protein n=1 Tax=Gordoniibacillus kamchatkensis TaxID=1590651 RepID=UPI0009E53C3A|nr:D-alanyl-D-alanine carboxypeptidase family protein [Paenibacillus sp. VKM B-2647]
MNRAMLLGLALTIAAALWLPAGAGAAPAITTRAEAAALIDVTSGRLLYSQQGDKPMLIASLTKIMTAIVAIEHGNLSDKVKVGSNAYRKEGSSIYLQLGEEMKLSDMLYGMMLRSGNDAATAIAEHVGGSVEGFAYMMNEKAKLIGMDHTNFRNPTGLNQNEHYSTANDMARLVAYAMKNPTFREIVKTKMKTAPNPNEPWDYKWKNKNKMLSLYDGADGVKTGYTKLAKRCLASSATRGGRQLAVVTLNDPDDWNDHARLLNYGFANFPLERVIAKGDLVDLPGAGQRDSEGESGEGPQGAAGASFYYPFMAGEQTSLSHKFSPNSPRSAAYRLGELGTLEYYLAGRKIGSVPIYVKNDARLLEPDRTAFGTEVVAVGATGWERLAFALRVTIRSLFDTEALGRWEQR